MSYGYGSTHARVVNYDLTDTWSARSRDRDLIAATQALVLGIRRAVIIVFTVLLRPVGDENF